MIFYNLYQRIPTDWIGAGLGLLVLWLILRFGNRDDVGNRVRDVAANSVLLYIVFSRFVAGILLHFNFNLRNDLLSALDGSASYGWLIGLLTVVAYVLMVVRKDELLQTDAARTRLTEALFVVMLLYFVYICATSLHPYRLEAGLRAIGIFVLYVLVRQRRWAPNIKAPLASVGFGLWLLLTSTLVPRTVVWWWFSPAQWWFVALIAGTWWLARPDEPQNGGGSR